MPSYHVVSPDGKVQKVGRGKAPTGVLHFRPFFGCPKALKSSHDAQALPEDGASVMLRTGRDEPSDLLTGAAWMGHY